MLHGANITNDAEKLHPFRTTQQKKTTHSDNGPPVDGEESEESFRGKALHLHDTKLRETL
jgi:hypothetical protein